MSSTEHRLSFAKSPEGRLDGLRWLREARNAPQSTEWLSEAACIGQTDRFYSEERKIEAEALAICRACPVSALCARYALDVEQYGTRSAVLGVLGGATARERRKFYDHNMRRIDSWAS
jgi:hypothetical protein